MKLERGKRTLVLGLARSGEAVAHLLSEYGLDVTVNERRERTEADYGAAELEALGVQLVFGGHPLSLLDPPPAFIVKNPGIPYSVPILQEAVRRGIPVYTEIEVASWLTESPIYAITGSNGKTTTTTLVGEMLSAAQLRPMVAGNIGRVLSSVVQQLTKDQPIVLEVSSFQLLGTASFHPRIAALLNVYPAHLDYHETLASYVDAKWRMFQNMTDEDVAVLNYDQAEIRSRAEHMEAHKVWFSRTGEVPEGTFIRDQTIVIRKDGQEFPLMPLSALALKGEHNLENALAAVAIALWAGAATEAVEQVLTRFRGVEHRLEYVRTVAGVDYYNDSKATNPQAALQALRSFAGGIVWIAGGLARGDDFQVMADEVSRRVDAVVLLGQTADALAAMCAAAGVATVEKVDSVEQATLLAHRIAQPGQTVLLSPACASWDMYPSFEVRGRMFKDAVHTL